MVSPPGQRSEEENTGRAAFTWRSILLGVLMCILIGIVGPYWTFYQQSSTLFLDYSVGGVMFFLFIIVLLMNGILGTVWRWVQEPLRLLVLNILVLAAGSVLLYLAPQIGGTTRALGFSGWGLFAFLAGVALAVAGLLGIILLGKALRSAELIVVTAMMLVGGAITTMGLTGYLVPNITAPYYLADPTNKWEKKLWPKLPKWAAPLDVVTEMHYVEGKQVPKKVVRIDTIKTFYDGLEDVPDVWTGDVVESARNAVRVTRMMPWGPWMKPLGLWAVFLMALYGSMISLMAIVRKQWMDYERLSFPIAQVPQELCTTAADPWGKKSIFRRKMFWFGFAVPFIVGSLTALNRWYDWVPKIPTHMDIKDIGPYPMRIRLSFAVLGFTFLIPNQVAFSIWSLNLVSFAFRSILKSYGLEMEENLGLYGAVRYPIMAHQGMGAMLVFSIASLYFARRHILRVLKCALHVGNRGYDENEPASYSLSVAVLAISLVVMVAWLTVAGLEWFYAILFIIVALLIFYGLTRVVAQCGVSVTIAPMIAPVYMTSTFGGQNISATGVMVLTQAWTWSSDIRTTVMSSAVHGMYLARKKARGLLLTLLVAALVTFAVGTLATIWLGYRYGAGNLHGWFFINGPPYTYKWGLQEVSTSNPPNWAGHVWTLVGAAIMLALTVAHRSLFWWPFHPVGFIICSVDWTNLLWFTIFLAWIFKALITKFGGNRPLRYARNFFLGMILGQFSVAGFWALVDTITGTTQHSIFWI